MSEELFRGHLDECLKHLSEAMAQKWPEGSKGSGRAKKPMADFCGVGPATVTGWLRAPFRAPNGETYFKLLCYLDLMGYRVIELENTPKSHRNFLELIGYSLLPGKEATRAVGYSEPSDFYQVLRGKSGISSKKEGIMWTLWKERKNQLVEKKLAATASKIDIYRSATAPEKGVRPTELNASRKKDAVLSIMDGLVELLDNGSLDRLTDADIAANERTILRLTAHMNSINSRLILSNEGGGS